MDEEIKMEADLFVDFLAKRGHKVTPELAQEMLDDHRRSHISFAGIPTPEQARESYFNLVMDSEEAEGRLSTKD